MSSSRTCVSCGSRTLIDAICHWCRRPAAAHASVPEHLFATPVRGTAKAAAKGNS